jgi:DNA-binding MarR family transcriptional regulator
MMSKEDDHLQGSYAEIFGLIDRMAKRLRSIERAVIQQTGLTPSQLAVIRHLSTIDTGLPKELAGVLQCAPATVTGIVDTMERNGLVARIPNPADRRSTLIKLLDEGRVKLEAAPELDELLGTCCGDLSIEDLRTLGAMLRRLESSLECGPARAHGERSAREGEKP